MQQKARQAPSRRLQGQERPRICDRGRYRVASVRFCGCLVSILASIRPSGTLSLRSSGRQTRATATTRSTTRLVARSGGTPTARCRSNERFRTMASRGQRSSVVEQLFRKQQVFGSNPNVGSTFFYTKRALDEVLADRAFAKTTITRLWRGKQASGSVPARGTAR